MTTLKKLNFITSNRNKLAEVRAILGNAIEVDNQGLDIPEIQGTIEEIAREKCRRAAEVIKGPVLTEDTALEFYALKGLPGPYIKPFLDVLGHEGLNKILDSFEDKSADAICTFAFSHGPGSEGPSNFGTHNLSLLRPEFPAYIWSLGWDPIFEYEGKTYAEMDKEEKVIPELAFQPLPF
ncbi:inosine triphosphate pyrophosphatase [Aspergillus oryzae 100-8]|uniref:XTP/dITP diphosphatase n=1 Tax=Aspergillus oryzae (strain 3.042) TaxID=1160506 RepID=I7ZJZ3_ASPO3|nr:inosine triphosphate pyrophosphatase [Aspergillus oryzae 3.042]KDE76243.1 inosine triphosphate pyrophosphatase [Aspergillus oryzae 100-8]|eukprot:EIT72259.1 inosine triphosphate pyrophosphatase [Aspergillus oryzae 3.042]